MNKRHFSLIELLITIAVIAILAGLLMPALNMAKQKAIDLHCINNLKQFGTAFMTYRSDSEDKMPMSFMQGSSATAQQSQSTDIFFMTLT